MDKPFKTTTELEAGERRQRSFILWLKRLGLVGFLFFLIKGLLWILIPVLVAKGC